MKLKKTILVALAALTFTTANAGGYLTNTNQSAAFLRNPAREGMIAIDGVYSNPAGVAFLGQGFHLGLNAQAAWQTRTIDTTCPLFALGKENNGMTTKRFKGDAQAPFIPSVHAAYNKDRWSFQFGFSVTGGGGKCEFSDGLGSFESAVGMIAKKLEAFGAEGYDVNSYMQGRQFYFGFTVGAAYKVTENLSVYGGLRVIYGDASYKAKISDIMVKTKEQYVPFSNFLDGVNDYITNNLTSIEENLPKVNALEIYREGVNLKSDQNGIGFAPVIGIDYKIGNFNFAAKYDFRVKMSMKNNSTVKEAMAIEAVNQFQDGTSVREDSPALLALGAQWSIVPSVRVSAGYHHFYDKQSKKYNDKQDLLKGGTDEYLAGLELDVTKKLTLSGGMQITRYGNTDEFMSDMSFTTDSWSYGFGAKYQVNDKVAINAAYFKTCYDKYTAEKPEITNEFTRSNRVAALGVELTF